MRAYRYGIACTNTLRPRMPCSGLHALAATPAFPPTPHDARLRAQLPAACKEGVLHAHAHVHCILGANAGSTRVRNTSLQPQYHGEDRCCMPCHAANSVASVPEVKPFIRMRSPQQSKTLTRLTSLPYESAPELYDKIWQLLSQCDGLL